MFDVLSLLWTGGNDLPTRRDPVKMGQILSSTLTANSFILLRMMRRFIQLIYFAAC